MNRVGYQYQECQDKARELAKLAKRANYTKDVETCLEQAHLLRKSMIGSQDRDEKQCRNWITVMLQKIMLVTFNMFEHATTSTTIPIIDDLPLLLKDDTTFSIGLTKFSFLQILKKLHSKDAEKMNALMSSVEECTKSCYMGEKDRNDYITLQNDAINLLFEYVNSQITE